jgi:fatty acid-binding protein DegV
LGLQKETVSWKIAFVTRRFLALEDAGCSDAAILTHCREPGEHVRGCWVVDQVQPLVGRGFAFSPQMVQ